MSKLIKGFTRGVECVAAMLLAAIFFIFLVQIFTRYAANLAWLMPLPFVADWMSSLQPIGWTVRLISLFWVWLIFFGCSFIVREKDHVTFDIVYLAVPRHVRKVLAIITAIILIVAMVYSLPATWDSVFANRLMDLKKIQTLRMPITGDKIAVKWLFAPYVLLMGVVILRSIWQIFSVAKYGPPPTELELLAAQENTPAGDQK